MEFFEHNKMLCYSIVISWGLRKPLSSETAKVVIKYNHKYYYKVLSVMVKNGFRYPGQKGQQKYLVKKNNGIKKLIVTKNNGITKFIGRMFRRTPLMIFPSDLGPDAENKYKLICNTEYEKYIF